MPDEKNLAVNNDIYIGDICSVAANIGKLYILQLVLSGPQYLSNTTLALLPSPNYISN